MIDPDGIIITMSELSDSIVLKDVPDCDFESFDLSDDKSFERYVKEIDMLVRSSFEYRYKFIPFLKKYFGFNKCAFLQNVTNVENSKIKIEIHHYPFTLGDIIRIVYRKRAYYGESLDTPMVAKEILQLHFLAMVGLIPMSITAHKLYHNSKLFIDVNVVFGRWQYFVEYYRPFITDEQMDVLNRIEKYSNEGSPVQNRTILNTNLVYLDKRDKQFQLPDMNQTVDFLKNRVQAIKDNGYVLPNVRDHLTIEQKTDDRRALTCPLIFH